MISAAVEIKQYLYLLAGQVWPGIDISGMDLRPMVITLHKNPRYRDEVLRTYTSIMDEAFLRQSNMDKENAGKPGYEQPYIGSFIGRIPKSESAKVAVTVLATMLGKIRTDLSSPGKCTVTIPEAEQKTLLGWLS